MNNLKKDSDFIEIMKEIKKIIKFITKKKNKKSYPKG